MLRSLPFRYTVLPRYFLKPQQRFYAERPRFIDKKIFVAHAGKGGDGAISFRRERFIERGGPDGGSGGNGGSVIVVASSKVRSLESVDKICRAGDGENGQGRNMIGKRGEDKIVYVPVGTVLRDVDEDVILADLSKDGQRVVIAKGGIGGKGNRHFATGSVRAPYINTLGTPGDKLVVECELKSIADVGLVGYPNAGKSTFLAAISKVKPKIAPYPFTTLHPLVGRVEMDDFYTFTVADIPGLIEGAHMNMGLGHEFLRHIERTKILVYVIDISGLEPLGVRKKSDGTIVYESVDTSIYPAVDVKSSTPPIDYSIKQKTNDEIERNIREKHIESAMCDYNIEDENMYVNYEEKEEVDLSHIKLRKKEPIFDPIKYNELRKNRDQLYLKTPVEVLKILEEELENYIPGLSERAKIIIANKIDIPGASKNLEELKKVTKLPIFPISAKFGNNITPVLEKIRELLLREQREAEKKKI